MQALPSSRRFLPRNLVTCLIALGTASLLCALSVAESADAAKRRIGSVDTSITSGPAAGSVITTSSASFGFTASRAGSSFQCRVDSASFSSCSSPHTTAALSDGVHTFSVRAVDLSGNVDTSPASRNFTVNTAATEEPPPDPGGTPPSAVPTSWSRTASFESDLNGGTDYGWRIDSPFSLSRTSEAGADTGSYAAKIATNGGNSSCSCPRMTFDNLGYGSGRDIWIGGSWRVADPSKLRWSRLMNLGHFEASGDPDNWYLALMVRDSGMEVVARHYQTDAGASVLMAPRAIPVNRWFDVDIHLRLSEVTGQALTEVYLDGVLISTSTTKNMLTGGTLNFYNAGLPYFWNGNGSTTVYFDSPRIRG
jgi:hypothetical protein